MNCPCRGDPSGRVGLCRSRCSSCAVPSVPAVYPAPLSVAIFLPFLPCQGGFLCCRVRRAGSILSLFSCCPFQPARHSSACARCDPSAPPVPGPAPALPPQPRLRGTGGEGAEPCLWHCPSSAMASTQVSAPVTTSQCPPGCVLCVPGPCAPGCAGSCALPGVHTSLCVTPGLVGPRGAHIALCDPRVARAVGAAGGSGSP